MRLDTVHMYLLKALEREYRSLENVPENNRKLLTIRKFLNAKESKKPKTKYATKNKTAGYDVELCYNICCDRMNGTTIATIAEDYDISVTAVSYILENCNLKRNRKWVANLKFEHKRYEADDVKSLLTKIHRYARYKNLTLVNARSLASEGRLYKNSLTIEAIDTFPKISRDEIKRMIFIRRSKHKSVKQLKSVIDFLNQINGEGYYSDEDAIRWTSR